MFFCVGITMLRTKKRVPRSDTTRLTELVKKVNATLSSPSRRHVKHANLTTEEARALVVLASPTVPATTILTRGGRVRTRAGLAAELQRRTRGRSVLSRAGATLYNVYSIVHHWPNHHCLDRHVRYLRAKDLLQTWRMLTKKEEAVMVRAARQRRHAPRATEAALQALRKHILDRRGLAVCIVHPLTGQLRGTCAEIDAACHVYSCMRRRAPSAKNRAQVRRDSRGHGVPEGRRWTTPAAGK